jgi:hypothetical protein
MLVDTQLWPEHDWTEAVWSSNSMITASERLIHNFSPRTQLACLSPMQCNGRQERSTNPTTLNER